MPRYIGDYPTSGSINFTFTSLGTAGTATTLSGGSVVVYKNNSLTESSAGVALTADYDSRTGLNMVSIDLAQDTAFYAASADFNVVLAKGTANSITLDGYTLAQFSVGNRIVNWGKVFLPTTANALTNTSVGTAGVASTVAAGTVTVGGYTTGNTPLQPTVAGRTLDVSTGGEAGVDWANVGSPTSVLGLTNTTVGIVTTANLNMSQSVPGSPVDNTTGQSLSLAINGVTVSSMASGVIGSGQIATDAIGSTQLATTAVNEIVSAVLTTAMTESYNADGSPPTVAQALMLILQTLTDFSISGVTWTVKKLDGSTTAATLTLNDATNPTSVTRTG